MDDEAREFCEQTRPRLVGSLSLMVGDADVAEDLAQEALARVWLHWKKVGPYGRPRTTAWTYRVAINLANSWIRRRGVERRAVTRLISMSEPTHTDPDQADAIAVRRAVAALPRRQRTALVLRYYADLPVNDVAKLMKITPGTVKSQTSQAVTALRKQLAVPDRSEATDGP